MKKISVRNLYGKYFKNRRNLDFPKQVTIELTSDCNLNCGVCPRKFIKNKNGYMDADLYKKIILECSKYRDVDIIPFFRGESLLHEDFMDLLRFTRENIKGRILLATNGSLMTKRLAKGILKNKIDFLSFSIDTIDEDEYRRLRGGGLKSVLSNIEYLLRLKKRRGVKKPEVQVSAVMDVKDKKRIRDFVDFWKKKVDRVRIYRQHSEEGRFGGLGMRYKTERTLPCLKPLTNIVVYFDGSVGLCNHDWDRKKSLGNIRKSSIYSIWNGKEYDRIREMHYNGKTGRLSPCGTCDHWKEYYAGYESPVGLLFKKFPLPLWENVFGSRRLYLKNASFHKIL